MSGIKSLEKLRNMHELGCDYETCVQCSIPKKMEKIADEVDAEIAERFMELPVDADGVPIHVGDEITDRDCIPGIVISVSATRVYCKDGSWVYPSDCHHFKPDSLEEVLCKALADASTGTPDWGRNLNPLDPYVTELADTVYATVMRENGVFLNERGSR